MASSTQQSMPSASSSSPSPQQTSSSGYATPESGPPVPETETTSTVAEDQVTGALKTSKQLQSKNGNLIGNNNNKNRQNQEQEMTSMGNTGSSSAAGRAVAGPSRPSTLTANNGNLPNNNRTPIATKSPSPRSLALSSPHVPEVREYLFKLLVIGELGTGKTSFIKRYVHQYFSQHYRATIGVDFALKVLNWDDNTLIRVQLWDIAGQERFGNMTRVYYKEAVGAFLVFDVNSPQTFNAVIKWKHDLDTKVCLADGNPIPCLLLANKCDSPKEGPAGNPETLDKFARDNGFCGWFYTSAKENINVEEASKFLVGKILQRQKHFVEDQPGNSDVISLDYSKHAQSSQPKKCSC